MNYDEVMNYIKENPGCTNNTIAEEFGVTVAAAFTYLNHLAAIGLLQKVPTRSARRRKVNGYHVVSWYDQEIPEEEDGSMPKDYVLAYLWRYAQNGNDPIAALRAHNDWREANGVELIDETELRDA
jgi:hypothetical protein